MSDTPDIPTPPEIEVTRRGVLKAGLLGGLVLTLGSGALLALRRGEKTPAAPKSLTAIDPAVFPVLCAVVARVLAPLEVVPEKVALHVDQNLTYGSPALAEDFSKVLALLENALAGLLTRRSITPFTRLAPEEQDRALTAWRDSPITALNVSYHALRKLTYGAFYEELPHARDIGYTGPAFEKPSPGPIAPRKPLSRPFIVAAELVFPDEEPSNE